MIEKDVGIFIKFFLEKGIVFEVGNTVKLYTGKSQNLNIISFKSSSSIYFCNISEISVINRRKYYVPKIMHDFDKIKFLTI